MQGFNDNEETGINIGISGATKPNCPNPGIVIPNWLLRDFEI